MGDNDTLSAQVTMDSSGSFGSLDGCGRPLYWQSQLGFDSQTFERKKIETINREIIDMAGGAGFSNGTGGVC